MKTIQETFDVLCATLDHASNLFRLCAEYEVKHGVRPPHKMLSNIDVLSQYNIYKAKGSWRDQNDPTLKSLWKTAKLMVKNEKKKQ